VKLNFRQGLNRHQKDVSGNPIFLQRSANGQFVDLIVSPDPTTITFAHRASTYVVDELRTVQNAWGPLVGAGTKYLFWDLNLLTGTLTRGLTFFPPLYTSASPTSPSADQYWFDTVENVGRVWNGKKWVESLRVFAGYVTSNAIIHPAPIGSEAGLIGNIEAGYIVLDSLGSPLRQSNGSFVTTTTWLNVVNLGTTVTRLEESIISGMAAEELPKYSFVQLRKGRRLVLARSTDYTSRISGIVTTDLYEGEISSVISDGVVKNDNWTFSENQINRPIFCGPTGQVTLTPPQTGVLQQAGFVYDVNSIFLEIKQVVVIDPPEIVVLPPPPPPINAPIANFSAGVVSGIAPLSVDFMSTSTGATSLEWDFTNDGYVDSTSLAPTYVFATPGMYTVRLRAINTFGQDDEIKTNFVTVTAPITGPTFTNLRMVFASAPQILAGQSFSLQVIVTNDGLLNATNVQRFIKLRSNNGSAITITSAPLGSTITTHGPITQIALPLFNIASGGMSAVANIIAVGASNISAIQIEGSVSSPETDSTPEDNKANLTITVRP
jgi:PKD repeat protein